MIAAPAHLLLAGDKIRHRDTDFDIADVRLLIDEVRPMVQLVVLRGGNAYQLKFEQTEFVARIVEGIPA